MRAWAIVLMIGGLMTSHTADAGPLDAHRWKHRLLVITAPSGDRLAEQQRGLFQSAAAGMAERQIVLIEALDDSEQAKRIRTALSADGKRFQVFLLGKDGGIKLASPTPLSATTLFGTVDAMPMRRNEMRRER